MSAPERRRLVRGKSWIRDSVLGAQAGAALGAPVAQHFASTFGGHASAEPMDTLALQFAGLVSAFHVDWPECGWAEKVGKSTG